VTEDLPCADLKLLAPLLESAEFRRIEDRVTSREPADAWLDDELHYFAFTLHPDDDDLLPDELPIALFVMNGYSRSPISAVTVTAMPDGNEAEVVDLTRPDSVGKVMPLG
jgi:hypothetical protein